MLEKINSKISYYTFQKFRVTDGQKQNQKSDSNRSLSLSPRYQKNDNGEQLRLKT